MKKFVCPQFRCSPGSDLLRKPRHGGVFSRLQNTIRRPGQILWVLLAIMIIFSVPAHAITCDEPMPTDKSSPTYQSDLTAFRDDCESKKNSLSGQAKTLAQALSILNTQIKLTQAKISTNQNQLDKLDIEITDLTSRISSIDYSLTDLTKLFIKRVKETYMYRSTFDAMIVAQTSGFGDAMRVVEYTKKVRDHDRTILISLEKSRLDFDTQKQAKEQKQQEIEALKKKLNTDKVILANQVKAKDQLLSETKNRETVYQTRSTEAQAELIAIQGIIAGLGIEVKVGAVGEGERIATIIQGTSPCSTGTHLHFEVAGNNPFTLLKNTSLNWDNADPAQNGTGSWNWPLNDPIRITQGYGHTSYSSIYANSLHTGVDMVSDNSTVKAVKPGELYHGSMRCGKDKNGNPRYLIYVHVKQADSYDTYYLHVNY